MALRREAAEARLLVVNHHLLFADLAARHEGAGYESAVVLPPFTRVIIDEAHAIENSATSFFSKGWSRLGISRSLSRLYRKRRTLETGLLIRLGALLPALPKTGADSAGDLSAGKSAAKAVSAVRDAAEKADAAALLLCGEEGLFRFTRGNGYEGDSLAALRQPLEKLRKTIHALLARIRSMTDLVDQEDATVWEVKAIARRLEAVAEIAGEFLSFDSDDSTGDNKVFWLEKQGGFRDDPWVRFTVTPVSIAPALKEALFEANKTVVCVSATMSTGGQVARVHESDGHDSCDAAAAFRFWAERSGAALANRAFRYGVFPSPFPYNKRALLAIPADAPLPDSPDYEAFTAEAITNLVRVAGGSALVLFTSYQALRNAYNEAAPILEREGIRCLKQGDDDRTRLLRRFLDDKTSVLFGTDSFWEGVDAPGETLRLLILCRLPFRTLRDPVFEARREALEKTGRSSFAELSLPDAVMKFKQGFGRLMRNSSDYGAVVVLDGRILRKYYGKVFLQALPETKTSFREFDGVTRDLERFLYD
jgi:ATP-dependent DNA helicase DinG